MAGPSPAMTARGHSSPSPHLRWAHAPGDLVAAFAFDHGEVVLALEVEPELGAVAEIAPRRTAVSAVIERRPLRMSVTRPEGIHLSRMGEVESARKRRPGEG